nr:methyltransferase domain-containing protein [Kocuria sp. JC486]
MIDQPYAQQLAGKVDGVRGLLAAARKDLHDLQWLDPVSGPEAGFRNKAKMVVAGTVAEPTLGILDPVGRGVDLRDCPLYPPAVTAALQQVARFARDLRLLPYDVPKGRGELKHVLLTVSPRNELMLRFVLRSQRQLDRIREHLPVLEAGLPDLRVVSVNVQPEHKAVLEGPTEILLTQQESLLMEVNGIPLHLRPRSFFQTNTHVAAALYRRAAAWADEVAPTEVLDLYCGVGGFALHLAGAGRDVVGVEVSEEAVAAAQRSARELGLPERGPGSARFGAGDATAWGGPSDDDGGVSDPLLQSGSGRLVVVNPPRRGLGEELSGRLENSSATDLIYSSCNAKTMARDLARMPSWLPVEAQLLDMFPHTGHYEVAMRLERR